MTNKMMNGPAPAGSAMKGILKGSGKQEIPVASSDFVDNFDLDDVSSSAGYDEEKFHQEMGNVNSAGAEDDNDNHSHVSSTKGGLDGSLKEEVEEGRNGQGLQEDVLGKQETAQVLKLRFVVFCCLLVASLVISTVVHSITTKAEEDALDSEFQDAAQKIVASFNSIVTLKLTALGSLAVALTSQSQQTERGWPFVTLPDFAEKAAVVKRLSDSLFIEVLPIVTQETRKEYELYTLENKNWLDESRNRQDDLGLGSFRRRHLSEAIDFSSGIGDQIYVFGEAGGIIADPGPGYYAPIWQQSPVLQQDLVNWNLLDYFGYEAGIRTCVENGEAVIGGIDTSVPGDGDSDVLTTQFFANIQSFRAGKAVAYKGDAMSSVYYPVFHEYRGNKEVGAVLLAVINWATYFEDILVGTKDSILVVLKNTCGGESTYRITGPTVEFLGLGDYHNPDYNDLVVEAAFPSVIEGTSEQEAIKLNQEVCSYTIEVYPTDDMHDEYISWSPVVFTAGVSAVFLFTMLLFVLYDRLVERRQKLIHDRAVQSTAIVSSLFPQAVTEKLIRDGPNGNLPLAAYQSPYKKLASFLTDGESDMDDGASVMSNDKPIADFFPNCTVLFADISGFTAWSSSREPAQVFILLQTVYQAFDAIAKKYKVFKVETIGDQYVAVTGLPEPQERHAVLMARFAQDCNDKMTELVQRLEVSLGPDTADLAMRFGMNSGPVTAGVLRGDRARFQLFGDTVNTAARMESTGVKHKIQVSQSTADLLRAANKAHWLTERSEEVEAKGKGTLKTFWLLPRVQRRSPSSAGSSGDGENNGPEVESSRSCARDLMSKASVSKIDASKKEDRLIGWNVQLLLGHIKKVVSRRNAIGEYFADRPEELVYVGQSDKMVLDEVQEVLELHKYDSNAIPDLDDDEDVEIPIEAESQLRNYVSIMAKMYHDNAFHNFEHASHVCMSVDKFIRRVHTPDIDVEDGDDLEMITAKLHDFTAGITSDPLAVLAIVFSALVHDCNHRGVSNMQLIKEDHLLGEKYKGKSVAEQNSVDLAWELLMAPDFGHLRQVMFATKHEMLRFRQVLVNVVLATDIFDKELNDLRKKRWNKVFNAEDVEGTNSTNGRATIVIEHIIQASDVAHTMQHWHIYRKWNERLFAEMYAAFKQGRMAKDPATFWYQGELGFFDNYVIPLAKKLEECQVFGVCSDECLNYATTNRKEWESKGQEVVAEMIEKYSSGSESGESHVGGNKA